MSGLNRTFKILLSRAYEVAVWAAFAGLAVHSVLTTGLLERSRENREATSATSDSAELLDFSAPTRR
jgi:hypothetical protein